MFGHAKSFLTHSVLALGLVFCPSITEAENIWTNGLDNLSSTVADILLYRDIGGRNAAEIYIRPPFDATYGVVCEPLSSRIARDIGFRLPPALAQRLRLETRIVNRLDSNETQLVLNVTWRDLDANRFELAVDVGDVTQGVTRLGGGSIEVSKGELRDSEVACLSELQIINRIEIAEQKLVVHRAPNPFSPQIMVIEAGDEFRLLGRMPYADGDWAIVRAIEVKSDPFAEDTGWVGLPASANEPARRMTRPSPAPQPLVSLEDDSGQRVIEAVSGQTTRVCADRSRLDVRVVRRPNGHEQLIRWIPPGAEASVAVEPGGVLVLSPICRLRFVRTTRKLEFIAVFEVLS